MSSSGYMAPEYATQGQLSIKSDVYSFGVLVLEIVTGLKNSSFDESESSYDLLSYVSVMAMQFYISLISYS